MHTQLPAGTAHKQTIFQVDTLYHPRDLLIPKARLVLCLKLIGLQMYYSARLRYTLHCISLAVLVAASLHKSASPVIRSECAVMSPLSKMSAQLRMPAVARLYSLSDSILYAYG